MKALSFLLTVVLIFAASSILAQTEISFEGITGISHDSVLSGGFTHTITLRYDVSGAPAGRSYLTANAFRIYSPDGADWNYVEGSIRSSFAGLGWDVVYVNHYNKTGGSGTFGLPQAIGTGNITGIDTVAVQLAGVNDQPEGGLPTGFNELVFDIEFSSNRADDRRHICIDTCRQISGGWEWANPDGLIEPDWSGVQCWVISCCAGKVGDVNGVGGDEPTIGDISSLIDFLFISTQQPDCLEEADVNLSGTLQHPPLDWSDVTIGDISTLIDHVFIDHPPLADCP